MTSSGGPRFGLRARSKDKIETKMNMKNMNWYFLIYFFILRIWFKLILW